MVLSPREAMVATSVCGAIVLVSLVFYYTGQTTDVHDCGGSGACQVAYLQQQETRIQPSSKGVVPPTPSQLHFQASKDGLNTPRATKPPIPRTIKTKKVTVTLKGRELEEEEERLFAELVDDQCMVDWTGTIHHELANWLETGVSLQQVDELCVRKAMRISVRGNEVRHMAWNLPSINLHRVVSAVWLIQLAVDRSVARKNPIPNLEIMLQPGDGSYSTAGPSMQWLDPGPLLSNIKCGNDASVSFPMTLHDQFGEGTGDHLISLWHKRLEQLVSWGNGAWLEKKNSAFFSAGFGATIRGNRSALFKMESPLVTAIPHGFPLTEYGTYRYLIYAYGHCGWSRRLHELAMMRTVVLMEHSTCREYMHHLFEPGKDYVPVAEDFSNVEATMEKLAANEKASHEMAEQWFKKGVESFRLTCVLDYVEGLLRKYASLQRFTPGPRPDWPLYKLGANKDYFRETGRDMHNEDACPPRPLDITHHFARSHVC
eukprot:m.257447 g.257447  ORF g.257447 m.257447 type:complete len:486 (-) comp15529_c1_seq1:2793-4250(-)